MRGERHRVNRWLWVLAVLAMLLAPAVYAGNDVMGEIQFEGKSKVEKTSGVWVDGKYVGYLKELHGSKTVLLLPGTHKIKVALPGYQSFETEINAQPNQKVEVKTDLVKTDAGGVDPMLGQGVSEHPATATAPASAAPSSSPPPPQEPATSPQR